MPDWKVRVDDALAAAVDESAHQNGLTRARWVREALWMRLEGERYRDRLTKVEAQLREHAQEIRRLQRQLDRDG